MIIQRIESIMKLWNDQCQVYGGQSVSQKGIVITDLAANLIV